MSEPHSSGTASSQTLSEETSQRALAYASFTRQILSGGIRAGQFVTQRELTNLLDTPLGAVREMIPRLEAGGLVKTVPQRGLQITPVDLKLIRNAFHIRSMIEREAITAFVRAASDSALRDIEARHQDILQQASAGNTSEQLLRHAQAVDWGLHESMVDALGNEIVAEMYRVNSLRIRLISQENPMQLVPAMQEHLRFIAALRKRDAQQACLMLDAHIEGARNRVLEAAFGSLPASPGNSWLQPAQARAAKTG
jgi:DNA-binding GntR family transcriptional regulator